MLYYVIFQTNHDKTDLMIIIHCLYSKGMLYKYILFLFYLY